MAVIGLAAQQNPPANSAQSTTSSGTRQEPAQIIQFLSRTISWHRQLALEDKLATNPAEVRFAQENQRIADQVVRLAFEYARGQAKLQAKSVSAQPAQPQASEASGQYQRLMQAAQRVEQQLQQTQGEVESLRSQLSRAPQSKKASLQAQIDETQSEVALLAARKDALENLTDFVNTGGDRGGAGLSAQIEELARSVPVSLSRGTVNAPENATDQQISSSAFGTSQSPPTGIWELSRELIRLYGKLRSLNSQLSSTEALDANARQVRTPLVSDMRALIHQGDQLATEADTSGAAALEQQKQQLDALTAQFKQVSAQMLPLGKIGVLLGNYESTLRDWKESVRDEIRDDLRQLILKVALLGLLVSIVFGFGELWRKATFRYVHDGRRRYQFLLLRRIVVAITIGIIVILTFASQIGSAVTFAGLLTAGVAVALQNVIVSIVGYFFLIGKYGLRVGDRVQVAGVTGEVVEIGLVRMHLMELGGPGENQPTGRVVAFSNSIVFQPASGLFKQIPGTNFVWHELKLTLASDTNYHEARERITKAVDSVLGKYQGDMDTQRRLMEQNLSPVASADLASKVRLRYASGGIEVTIRFPVEIGKAGEMDDHLMREVLDAAGKEPKIRVVSAEMPVSKVGE